jgi:hypothetical protein
LSGCRYALLLAILSKYEGKLCPTYDIDIIWHTHMTLPSAYRTDTQEFLGRILSHDDSINDRSADAELAQLQKTTEELFIQVLHIGSLSNVLASGQRYETCCPADHNMEHALM